MIIDGISKFTKILYEGVTSTFSKNVTFDDLSSKLDGMVIHDDLMKTLHKEGLYVEWREFMVKHRDRHIWLRNVEGIFVLLSEELISVLNMDNFDPLGKKPEDIVEYIKDDDYSDSFKHCHISDIEVKKYGEHIISRDCGCPKVNKFGIYNSEQELIAIFGVMFKDDVSSGCDRETKKCKNDEFIKHIKELVMENKRK